MIEIVWDTETTGTNPESDRVVEIGCVEIEDLLPTGRTFHCYINPQREVHPGAVRVHGLTYDFLKKFPTFRRQLTGFQRFIEGKRLVAHNGAFDERMINAELARLGLPPLENEMVDTLPMFRKVKKGKATLDAMLDYYGIDRSARTAHGALLDSQLLAEAYLQLNGGRQRAMSLKVEEVLIPEVVHQYGERTIIRRGTEAERAAHHEFVAKIKGALWSQYRAE